MRIAPIFNTKPDLKVKVIITWATKEVTLEDYNPNTQTQAHTRAQAQLFFIDQSMYVCMYAYT